MWLINVYLASVALIAEYIDEAPIQEDHHTWTDAELDVIDHQKIP